MRLLELLSDRLLYDCVFSYLELEDIPALRLVCKMLKVHIDKDFHRRFFKQFVYDTIWPEKPGFPGYLRRYKAQLVCFYGNRAREPEEFYAEWLKNRPIADFGSLYIGLKNEDEVLIGLDWNSNGIAIRGLDGHVSVRTEDAVEGELNTSGISQLRISYVCHFTEFLRGTESGKPVECDLRVVGRPEGSRRPVLGSETSQVHQLKMAHDRECLEDPCALKLGNPVVKHPRLIYSSPRQLYQSYKVYADTVAFPDEPEREWSRSEHVDTMISILADAAPEPLQGLTCSEQSICAGFVGKSVYVAREKIDDPSQEQDPRAPPIYDLHVFKFEHPIKKVSTVDMIFNCGGLLVLDKAGNLHDHWFQSPRKRVKPKDPQLLFERVADLVGQMVLMKNGKVKRFDEHTTKWKTIGTKGVLISSNMFLGTAV